MNTVPLSASLSAKRLVPRILAALILGWAAPASADAAGARIVLEAAQSNGGNVLLDRAGELIGVTLDKSCEAHFAHPRDARIEWPLAESLPAGWWRGIVETNFTGGYANRNISIMMVGGQNPAVRVAPNYVAVGKDEPQRFEFWIHTSAPSTAVRIQPFSDLWRWNYSWPVTRITLEQAGPSALAATDAVTLELPVAADGAVVLPFPLPTGNWSLSGHMRKAGEAVVEGAEGRPVTLAFNLDRWRKPGVYSAPFHLRSPLHRVHIVTNDLFASVLLQHQITRADAPIPVEGRLAVTVDPSRTIVEKLELLGTGLDGAAPSFPLLPQGKKNVVLTSWDDGKPEDLRCAEILVKHGYRPTFLLNGNSPALQFMDKLEALGAEIGSHAYHHAALSTLPPDRALENCVSMRLLLENRLGHPVVSFAFPDGYFPSQDEDGDYVLRALRDSGHWIARTHLTREETIEDIDEPLLMRSIGLYGSGNKALVAAWPRILEKEGGVFYLKGHSWQIGKTDEQWDKFEEFIARFAGHPQAWYPTKGEFGLWLWARDNIRLSVETHDSRRTVVRLERPWLHPWLAARCPLSLKLPAGVTSVRWQGRELPVIDDRVELIWAE